MGMLVAPTIIWDLFAQSWIYLHMDLFAASRPCGIHQKHRRSIRGVSDPIREHSLLCVHAPGCSSYRCVFAAELSVAKASGGHHDGSYPATSWPSRQ